ncbi:MAG: methionine--tRNA ligase [Spirochaetaceae bacterium]|jgi:methionyl-tRNA synthetase|nr:methionine--tRNA ligase [Spirochaetaceae bacterium]
MKRRLVTSALPYVNNVPHLGNLIQVLSADVFARFCRLRGYETLYICGTDEYGTATETRAAEEGISPRELCDRYHRIHADIYRWFNIAFDKFGRTSTPIQTEVTQDIFRKLDAAGYVSEKTIEQLHCASCGRFLADRYVLGTCPHCGYGGARGDQCENCGKLLDPAELENPRCSSCGSAPALKSTRHLYIDLPKIRERLEAWIEDARVKGFWANNAVQMTHAWIRDGLHERAITRDLKWGIPVPKPGYEDKVFYVWFDAPIGYISITGNLGDEIARAGGSVEDAGPEKTRRDWRGFVDYWWKNPGEVELFQFIGKDNIPFHTVIFPSSLLGTGENWTMLHHMSSTEYLNYESGKFSKSNGTGVFGTDAVETGIPADVWRFYIFYNRPEKSDALFTWKDFQEKVNGELIGNLGNLVNRTLSFIVRYYGGAIPGAAGDGLAGDGLPDTAFWKTVREYEDEIAARLEKAELRDAFHHIFTLASFANKTFQDGAPWKSRTENPGAAARLIRDLAHVVRDIAVMIEPYLPGAAERIAGFFGCTLDRKNPGGKRLLSWADAGKTLDLETVTEAEILFKKLEDDEINAFRERYSGSQKEREAKMSDTVPPRAAEQQAAENVSPAERFMRTLDIRTAHIVKVERHPNAEKLFIATLEIGGEERVIVSGLVGHYREEELLNKKIFVAYNLKPAKLRGVESRGMLLAAEIEKEDGSLIVEVLDAGDAPTGRRVSVEGAEGLSAVPPGEITIDVFASVPLAVENYAVHSGGKALLLDGKPLRTTIIAAGGVH